MHRTTALRLTAWTAAAAVLAGSLLSFSEEDALARRRRKARVGEVTEIFSTLGTQGRAGAGTRVQLGFRLVDAKKRLHTLDTEYGFDVNGDGLIGEDEYFSATTDDDDPRATIRRHRLKKDRFGERYSSAPGRGAVHAVVWDSETDLGAVAHLLQEPLLDASGREVRNPITGEVEMRRGTGMILRIRPRSGKGKAKRGEWAYSEPFELDNRAAPELVLGNVAPGAITVLDYTAIHTDAEDANGNGVLDVGEDADADGVLDQRFVRIVVDWYRLAPGEDPQAYSADELEALPWQAATPAGESVFEVEANPVGVNGSFQWAASTQIPAGTAGYILRARAVGDQAGDWQYVLSPITLAP